MDDGEDRWASALLARARPYAIPLGVTLAIGVLAVSRILERAGEPAVPLDDAFIHLQYARRLAEGAFFEYTPEGGYSSGATSLLWPILLAPLSAVGLEGVDLVWGAWLLGWLAHAAVTLETARFAAGLAGTRAGIAAGAMALAFGAFAWFAYSGMETVALAWVLIRGARVASELREPGAPRPFSGGPPPSPWQLVALGILAPLVRPEGALVSAMAVLAGVAALREARDGRRALQAFLPGLGPAIVPSLHLAFAGHAVSSTAQVKWLGASPYLDRAGVLRETWANVELLVTDVLDGGAYSSIFVPERFYVVVAVGLCAALWFAQAEKRWWRFAMLCLLLAGTFATCTYETMLWNRVRYVYPFAPGWLVCCACACALGGELVKRAAPDARAAVIVGPALAGALVGLLGVRLHLATLDLSISARAVARQQVALGRWAREHLPPDAILGVNDTGAIAYLSGRRTFDVVGLTTEGEARHWAAGAGARFEHYEHLAPDRRPTHFLVYPEWFEVPVVLGRPLVAATVREQSILGGPTMTGFEARWDALGSGRAPRRAPEGALVDRLDVADLDSEAAHAYALGDATRERCVVVGLVDAADRVVADGGRLLRAEERFVLAGGGAATLVMRVRHDDPLEVRVDDAVVGEVAVPPGPPAQGWSERRVSVPASSGPRAITVRALGARRFDAFHYWLFAE